MTDKEFFDNVKKYERTHCGRVLKVEDYRFLFEELDPKKMESKRQYWVMKSYFWKRGR